MINMMKKRIDIRLGLIALILVAIIMSLETLVSFQERRTALNDSFSENAQSITATAAKSMAFPLWDFDVEIITDMTNALLANPMVISTQVTEPNGSQIIQQLPVDQTAQDTAVHTAIILAPNGEELGRLDLTFSRATVHSELQAQLSNAILRTIGLCLLVFGVIAWTIRSTTRPLQQLETAVRAYDGRAALATVPGAQRLDAFGGLARGIKDMAQQIHMLVSGLETRVNERTSELEAALDNAKSANEAKSSFLANMSHEIRTPMNGVLGMAELLRETELAEKQKMFADTIYSSGSALLTIINDILDYSKIEAGKLELDPTPFDLQDAVEDVALLMGVAARDKGVELMVRVRPETPTQLIGDAGRIRQVLTNLVGNAIKFTHEGSVLIDISGENAHTLNGDTAALTMTISDSGIGMDPEKLDVIFEEFTQAESTTTRKYGGTGLGLSITRSLVTAMGGTISAKSQLGKGSDFSVLLDLPIAETALAKQSAPIAFKGETILVVDDNEINRTILAENLDLWGVTCILTESADQALKVLRQAARDAKQIDLVLTDYHMPLMDGMDFTRLIRSDATIAEAKIIVLSSVNDDNLSREFKELGVIETIAKPARMPYLKQAIGAALLDKNIATLKATAEAMPDLSDQTETVAAGDRPRILIADDNEINRDVLEHMIDPTLYEIDFAADGRIAYQKYRAGTYDFIFMDISMPVMDGIEAMKAIRAFEAENDRPKTPIVALTALAMSGDRERILEQGMDDYLAKPVKHTQVNDALEKWLSSDPESQECTG